MKIAGKWPLSQFLQGYRYQPDLTPRLDSSTAAPLDQARINELVLWKVNRYVRLEETTLELLNHVHEVPPGSHSEATELFALLLRTHGVDLPMASTFLRFRNPRAFQIIDRHAYRAVYGRDYPLHGSSPLERKRRVYFEYLDDLIDLARTQGLEFETLDRVLYVFDKSQNGPLRVAEQ